MYCTILYCITMYCIVMYCTKMYCITMYCIVMYCTTLYCITVYCIVVYQGDRETVSGRLIWKTVSERLHTLGSYSVISERRNQISGYGQDMG